MFHKKRKIGETKDLVNYAIFAKLYLPRILAYSIFDEFAKLSTTKQIYLQIHQTSVPPIFLNLQ